ncbi:MAG TPA: GntR family transcriptional regulator [Ruminiclostridium sp.]|nr:substrate-binding domain-containing protein [Clostridiaceae bacterium]HAA25996.1 GntR family transcriptional regulator [Ruminiclostridium sp.]
MNGKKPKYQKLIEYLKKTIIDSELKSGDKIPSENALSAKFNISRHTVRKALGELVNEGWLITIQGKGTFVRDTKTNNGNGRRIIGIMTTYLSDYIFPSIIRGIDQVLAGNGYNIVLCCTNNRFDTERICLNNLLNQNINGLIVETTKSALPNPNLDLYHMFRERNIPVLFMHGSYKGFDAASVYEDDVEAGYIAAKHLIELNHTKIGCIFKIDDKQGHARFEGFVKAHRENNLMVNDKNTIWFDTADLAYKIKENGPVEELINECTAIVCYNDQIALKMIDIVRAKNIPVPDRLSLVSFDDSDLATASEIKMTTVAHPKEKLGIEAANIMLKMLLKPGLKVNAKIKPELIIRASTGPVS